MVRFVLGVAASGVAISFVVIRSAFFLWRVAIIVRVVLRIEVDEVLLGVSNLELDLLVHDGVLQENLHVTEVLDNLDDVELGVEPVLRFVDQLDDLLLVFPAITAEVEGSKLVLEVVAQRVFPVHLYKSMFSYLIRRHCL